jgi:hypothetical protein
MDYVRTSGLHVLLLAACVAATGGLFLRAPRRQRAEAAMFGLALLLLLAAFASSPVEALQAALDHLQRGSRILAEADESLPLFHAGIAGAIDSLGLALFGLAIVFALLLRRPHPLAWVFGIVLASDLFFAMEQSRFSRQLAGSLAVAAALAVARAGSLPRWRLAAAVCAIVLILPTPAIFARAEGPHEVLALTRTSLEFLRERTPDAGGLRDPSVAPAYAVMAPWVVGNLVATLGERPVIASPFGQTADAERAIARSIEAFAERDPERLFEQLRRERARFLFTLPYPGGNESLSIAPSVLPCAELLRRAPLALGHFRLRFTAAEPWRGAPVGRIYEVVPGAHLVAPGDSFSVRIVLKDGTVLLGTASRELVVPWAREDLAGPIRVTSAGGEWEFAPDAAAVLSGGSVSPELGRH